MGESIKIVKKENTDFVPAKRDNYSTHSGQLSPHVVL